MQRPRSHCGPGTRQSRPGEQARRGLGPRGVGGEEEPQGCSKKALKTQRGCGQQGAVKDPRISGQAWGSPEVLLPEDQEEAGTLALFPAVTSTRHKLAHCPHPTDACGDWHEHLVLKMRTRCPWSPWH